MTFLKRVYGPMLQGKTYLETLYLLLGLAFGILWFVLFVTLFAVGIGTVVVWVGLAILIATMALLRPVGAIERLQVRWLLRHHVPTPAPLIVEPTRDAPHPEWTNLGRWSRALLRDTHSWRVLAWACIRIVAGPVGFSFAVVYISVPLSLVAAPVFASMDWGWDGYVDSTQELWRALSPYGPLAFLIVTPALAWVIRGLADAHRRLADWCLGPTEDEVRKVALARAARAEEQIRIDQELHDSIGHMVSMIVVQAGAGAHVFDKDPAFSRRALKNIEERGRAALGELDRIIARIRGDQPETLAPLPGVEDLPTLIEGAREAGVSVVSRLGLGEVPPALGRGIYRVIQEALTNAAKHAPGGKVEVVAVSGGGVSGASRGGVSGASRGGVSGASRGGLVAVSVTNTLTSPAKSDTTGGNGLASIRDRVTLMGGHATVGPTPDGRFAVKAVLPVEDMLPDEGRVDCSLTARCRCLVCRTVRSAK